MSQVLNFIKQIDSFKSRQNLIFKEKIRGYDEDLKRPLYNEMDFIVEGNYL